MILKGKVVSNKMAKTVVVEVTTLKKLPVYGKYVKISKRYKAHAGNPIDIGAEVRIEQTRPMSKHKRWRVV